MIKINKNLILFIGLLFGTTFILSFIFQKFLPLLSYAVYYCQSFVEASIVRIPNMLTLIPFGLVLITIIFATLKILILIIKTQYLIHSLKSKKGNASKKINLLINNLGLQGKIIVINSNKKFAFCLGFVKPKIYISTSLLSNLSIGEIESVLRHEQYHLENHDNRIYLIAFVFYSMFPFLPVISDLVRRYRIEREIQADRFTVKSIGESASLVSSLRKLLVAPAFETASLAAIGEQDTLEIRIYALLKKEYHYKHVKIQNLFITIISFVLIIAALAIPVHAEEFSKACIGQENMIKLYSEVKTYTPAP